MLTDVLKHILTFGVYGRQEGRQRFGVQLFVEMDGCVRLCKLSGRIPVKARKQ